MKDCVLWFENFLGPTCSKILNSLITIIFFIFICERFLSKFWSEEWQRNIANIFGPSLWKGIIFFEKDGFWSFLKAKSKWGFFTIWNYCLIRKKYWNELKLLSLNEVKESGDYFSQKEKDEKLKFKKNSHSIWLTSGSDKKSSITNGVFHIKRNKALYDWLFSIILISSWKFFEYFEPKVLKIYLILLRNRAKWMQ